MEPFRPVVDEAIAVYLKEEDADLDLNPATKRVLLQALRRQVKVAEESHSIFTAAGFLCASLAMMYQGKRKKLTLPAL